MRLSASYNKSFNTGLASKPPIHFSTSAAGQPVKPLVRANFIMHRKLLAAFLIFTAIILGCSDNSSEERIREVLGIPKNQELTESLVSERVKALVPVETPEWLVAEKLKRAGIGEDSLSSYSFIPTKNIAVVRVEFDSNTSGVVKSTWIITLQFDSLKKLQAVSAKRYLTGI